MSGVSTRGKEGQREAEGRGGWGEKKGTMLVEDGCLALQRNWVGGRGAPEGGGMER